MTCMKLPLPPLHLFTLILLVNMTNGKINLCMDYNLHASNWHLVTKTFDSKASSTSSHGFLFLLRLFNSNCFFHSGGPAKKQRLHLVSWAFFFIINASLFLCLTTTKFSDSVTHTSSHITASPTPFRHTGISFAAQKSIWNEFLYN